MIADYGEPTRWSDWDASVFLMTKVGQQLQGEYQLCNGYGTDKAAPVLRVRYTIQFIYVRCSFSEAPPVSWQAEDELPLTGGAYSSSADWLVFRLRLSE